MSETRIEAGLLEREDELASLTALLAATERGEGSLAVIEGTAGVGKTRLLLETRARADLVYRTGTAALVERANQELAATGARPRIEVVGGIYSLTASEQRVAELAAQEKSNKVRAGAVRNGEDSRGPPVERLLQARDQLSALARDLALGVAPKDQGRI